MKKVIAFLLCLCLVLSGCGASTAETQPETTEATPTTVATEAPTEAPTNASTETIAALEGTIAETVVYDDGTFKLTAKEIDYSDKYNIKIKLLAENNSDKTVSFLGSNFSINGITMYCSFYCEVAPGKKANDSIDIDRDDLEKYGIKSIATVKGQDPYIYNKDDKETIARFQFSLETSISDGYVQEIDKSGQTIYDKDGVVIKYRGIETDWSGDEVLSFYVENNTDVDFGVYVDDTSVNGFMVYGSMVAYAYSGCVTYEELDFLSSDMEENDIDSIEEVSFTMYAYNRENGKLWTTDEIIVGQVPSESLPLQPEETTGEAADDIPEKVESAAAVLRNTMVDYFDNFEVVCDGTTIYAYIWQSGNAMTSAKAAQGNSECLESWNSFVDSVVEASATVSETVRKMAGDDVIVFFSVKNDLNLEKILITASDGILIYDAVNSK